MSQPSSRKEIFRLAIPNIISNITIPCLSLVDVGLAGHMPHQEAIGSVAVATTITNTLFWLFGFLRLSATGFTAQALGGQDSEGVRMTLARGLVLALCSTLLVAFLAPWVVYFAGIVSHSHTQITADARLYLGIILTSTPAVMLIYVLNGWFIGLQNTRIPMIGAISSNVVNILLSSFFVVRWGWGIEGIAWGSVLAQYFSVALLVLFAKSRYSEYLPSFKRFGSVEKTIRIVSSSDSDPFLGRFGSFFRLLNIGRLFRSLFVSTQELKSYLLVGRDLFFRSALLSGITLFFTYASTSMGAQMIATNTLLMQLFLIFSYFMDGFAYAGEALVGKYYGMQRNDLLGRVVKSLFVIGLLFAVIFSLGYALALEPILSVLSDKAEIIAEAQNFRLWVALIPLMGFGAFLWDGIYVGLTRARELMLSMWISVCFFFVSYFALTPWCGADALWISFDGYLLLRGLAQWRLWRVRIMQR